MENQKWKVGKHKSVVVSDTKILNNNFKNHLNPEYSEDKDIEYYGGYLICESVGNDKIAKLIAEAPELLRCIKEAIKSLEFTTGSAPDDWYDIVQRVESE